VDVGKERVTKLPAAIPLVGKLEEATILLHYSAYNTTRQKMNM